MTRQLGGWLSVDFALVYMLHFHYEIAPLPGWNEYSSVDNSIHNFCNRSNLLVLERPSNQLDAYWL